MTESFSPQPNPGVSPNDETQVWNIAEIAGHLPEEVKEVADEFNSKSYDELTADFTQTTRRDEETGVEYAVIGDEGHSRSEGVVEFLTFANRLDEGVLLRAAFQARVNKLLGVADEKGDPLPVVVLSSPNHQSTVRPLSLRDYWDVSKGRFDSVTSAYLRTAKKVVGRAAIVGYSQGAAMATNAAQNAAVNGIDATALVVAEPPNVKRRTARQFFVEHTSEGSELSKDLIAAEIEAFVTAHRRWGSTRQFAGRIITQASINAAIYLGLSRDAFFEDLRLVAEQGIESTVGWGTKSATCPAEEMEPRIEAIRAGTTARAAINTLTVTGGYHSWCGRADTMAAFYGRGLVNARNG